MADLVPYRPLLELYFDNKRPITASELGELLSTLAKDFRRYRKESELVVVDVENGSLRVLLTSVAAGLVVAADAMAHANDAIDFGKHISEVIKWSAAHGEPPKRQMAGVSSAKAILDTAVASKARFKLNYRSPQGEQLYVEMDAPAAAVAREAIEPPPKPKPRKHSRAALTDATNRRGDTSLVHKVPLLPDAAVDRLLQYRDALPKGASVTDDGGFRAAIHLFVESMETSGNEYGLNDIEAKLEVRGLYEIAAMVREARTNPDQTLRLTQDR